MASPVMTSTLAMSAWSKQCFDKKREKVLLGLRDDLDQQVETPADPEDVDDLRVDGEPLADLGRGPRRARP